MKKIVLKLEVHDDKGKRKAMKAVSNLSGIDTLSINIREKKLIVIGDVDPVQVAVKLKKILLNPEILLVGPAKEPEKKKKDESVIKRNEGGQYDHSEKVDELVKLYKNYNPNMTPYYNVYYSMEENPNACIIC